MRITFAVSLPQLEKLHVCMSVNLQVPCNGVYVNHPTNRFGDTADVDWRFGVGLRHIPAFKHVRTLLAAVT